MRWNSSRSGPASCLSHKHPALIVNKRSSHKSPHRRLITPRGGEWIRPTLIPIYYRVCQKSDTSRTYITLYERYHFFGPPGTWFLVPTRVSTPNGISISSAVFFAGLTFVSKSITSLIRRMHYHYAKPPLSGPSRGGEGVSYPGPCSVWGAPRSLEGEAACRGPQEWPLFPRASNWLWTGLTTVCRSNIWAISMWPQQGCG